MQPTHNTATTAEHPTRRVDSKPETDADRRFFDLRESGYLGWIDQDGYPVDETGARCADCGAPNPFNTPCQKAPAAAATVNVGSVLRQAARYLARHGWVQGAYYDQAATVFTPAACTVGAIGTVCYGGPVEAPAQMFTEPEFEYFEAALAWLDGFVFLTYGFESSYDFNDEPGQTRDDVVRVLGEAAGAWDKAHSPAHADYPHQPGTLYDCPACESSCFCGDGFECVHCAIAADNAVKAHWDATDATVQDYLFGGDAR